MMMTEQVYQRIEPTLLPEERLDAIRDLAEGKQASLELCSPYHSGDHGKQISEAILIGPWFCPLPEANNVIFAQGISVHDRAWPGEFSPTSVFLENGERVDMVIKPASSEGKARHEVRVLNEIVFNDCVRVCQPLGVLQIQDRSYVLTLLEKGIIPLAFLRLEAMRQSDQIFILDSLAQSLASMHNHFIAHRDLHPSNLAVDSSFARRISRRRPEDCLPGVDQIVFFDFEKSAMMSKKYRNSPRNYPRKVMFFESRAIDDLANIGVHLTRFTANLKEEEVEKHLVNKYFSLRRRCRKEIMPQREVVSLLGERLGYFAKKEAARAERKKSLGLT
jgi:hypothetical protein